MRTYGIVGEFNPAINGYNWQEVDTDANGFNDAVYLTTLTQVLQLSLNESPFYGSFGLPAEQSVIQQLFPNYNVSLLQQYFSQYFASLRVNQTTTDVDGVATPTYNVSIITNQGAQLSASVIPQ